MCFLAADYFLYFFYLAKMPLLVLEALNTLAYNPSTKPLWQAPYLSSCKLASSFELGAAVASAASSLGVLGEDLAKLMGDAEAALVEEIEKLAAKLKVQRVAGTPLGGFDFLQRGTRSAILVFKPDLHAHPSMLELKRVLQEQRSLNITLDGHTVAVPMHSKAYPKQGYTHKLVFTQVCTEFRVQGLTRLFLQGYGVCSAPDCVLVEELGNHSAGSIVTCDTVVAYVRLPEGADLAPLPREFKMYDQTMRIIVYEADSFPADPGVPPPTRMPEAGVPPARTDQPSEVPPASAPAQRHAAGLGTSAAPATTAEEQDAGPSTSAPTAQVQSQTKAGSQPQQTPTATSPPASRRSTQPRAAPATEPSQQPHAASTSSQPPDDNPSARKRQARAAGQSVHTLPAALQQEQPGASRRPRPSSATPSEAGARPHARRRTTEQPPDVDDDYGAPSTVPTSHEVEAARRAFTSRLGATSDRWVAGVMVRQGKLERTSHDSGKVLCQFPMWPLTSILHYALPDYAPGTIVVSSEAERQEFLNYFWQAFRAPYGLDALKDANTVGAVPSMLLQELRLRAAEMQAVYDTHPLNTARRTRSQHHHATAGPGAAGRRVVD